MARRRTRTGPYQDINNNFLTQARLSSLFLISVRDLNHLNFYLFIESDRIKIIIYRVGPDRIELIILVS